MLAMAKPELPVPQVVREHSELGRHGSGCTVGRLFRACSPRCPA